VEHSNGSGGGGTIMRGPGETQLETDPSNHLDKFSPEAELKEIDNRKVPAQNRENW
jgi:GTP-binding protein HflX